MKGVLIGGFYILNLVNGFCLPNYDERKAIIVKIDAKTNLEIDESFVSSSLSNLDQSRRYILKSQIAAVLTVGGLSTQSAIAAIEDPNTRQDSESELALTSSSKRRQPQKPFAPPAALLPATRVKLLIEQSLSLLDDLLDSDKSSIDESKKKQMLQDTIISLQRNLLLQQTYMLPLYENVKKQIEETKDIHLKSNSKLYDDTYNNIMKSASPQDVPYLLLVKAGEQREINILKQQQKYLEKQNAIREAFNFYTKQLQFDTEFYVLNASPTEKKKMIRNDALPDIKSVIVSDLDLRDLVRNQVLDAVDDAKAELMYQMKQYDDSGIFDGSELRTCLLRAQGMINQWFGFIPENDVAVAVETVSKEMTDRK
jgi:hypothetical protein